MVLQRQKIATSQRSNGTSSADERAASIYQTAARLICEKGFDATSMSDIARAVNLTKAGLYYYVPGKKELLFAIVRYAMETIETGVIEPCQGIRDPSVRLREIVRRHTLLLTQIGTGITILTDEMNGLTPRHRRQIIAKKRAYLDFVRSTLDSLKRSRRLRSSNVGMVSMNLFATVLGVAHWYRADGGSSGENVADEVADYVMAAILKPSC